MDGCGRTASGTAVESNAGAVAEQLQAMPWTACMPATQDDCTDAGGTHPWMNAVERRRERPSRAMQEPLPSSCRRCMDGLHAGNAQAWVPGSHDYRARAGSLYSTRVITQRRRPCGVRTSNSSSTRRLSAARANGASMLIQPRAASVSSAPTMR